MQVGLLYSTKVELEVGLVHDLVLLDHFVIVGVHAWHGHIALFWGLVHVEGETGCIWGGLGKEGF